MRKLSDFKPLKQVVLPGLGDLTCSGLVLIVGPNSSGKSQFLQDLYHRMAGEPRQLVVASDIQIEKPPIDPFLQCLEDEGYFSPFFDDAGNKHLRPQTMYLGSGQPIGQIQPHQAQQWHGGFAPESTQISRRRNEFLNYFGRLLVTGLFLDRRLISLNSTGVIDFLTQPPQHDLHALYLDDHARQLLYEDVLSSFGRAVWPDMSRGNQITLKVSDEDVLPTPEDRHSCHKMAQFRSIETEGDGLKSYLATCVSLLLGRRPVCLIDEPELCLHPPQAYNLGKFIGRFGASNDTATFVATHSSHLLRGVLQTAEQVQIIRLTRRAKTFSAHLVPRQALAEALTRPTLRAESVLDGVFSQAVVVVEADGDRLVYQAAWESIKDKARLDLHFATVGGTGGLADTCQLYRTLRIPVAVIADLDVLVDDGRIGRVLESLVNDPAACTALHESCRAVASAVQSLPPVVSPKVVGERLAKIGQLRRDWSKRDDVSVRNELRALSNDIDRMRRLKRGGIADFDQPLQGQIRDIVDRLARIGLFLVPVGELEEWLAAHDVGVSKSDKRAWSNAAAELISKVGQQDGDVWAFMRAVAQFLTGLANATSQQEVAADNPSS